MGAAINGRQNNLNNSDHNSKKKSTKKKNWNNKNKSKGKGFNGAARDGPLNGIVLTTNEPVPLYKWLEGLQAYANDKGMVHVTNCIDNMEDLNMDDF